MHLPCCIGHQQEIIFFKVLYAFKLYDSHPAKNEGHWMRYFQYALNEIFHLN